jgi:methyltransferase family protein
MKRYLLDRLNRILEPVNVRLETLTAERAERRRLDGLVKNRHFDRPAYGAFRSSLLIDTSRIMETIAAQSSSFSKFVAPHLNDVHYSFDNSYFSSPDCEVLYALIGMHRPARIVEVGSGNSTRVMRQAILDYGLSTRIVSIDPDPRIAVATYADEIYRCRVEELEAEQIAGWLEANDILFIDSSHLIAIGNDVPFLYFEVLPRLRAGVLVHIHDIFLPYEYPLEWVENEKWGFNEQILLNAILTWSDAFKILWPGRFQQMSDPTFATSFPHSKGRRAQSFWLRKENSIPLAD